MAEATKTALVGQEKGECSQFEDQIMDVARLKPGAGTVTSTGTSSAQTATLNAACGVITTGATTLSVAQDATATVTLTNSKVQAGDMVLAMVDATGASAGSQPFIANVVVSAGSVVFTIGNPASTTLGTGVKIYFLVITAGNTGN